MVGDGIIQAGKKSNPQQVEWVMELWKQLWGRSSCLVCKYLLECVCVWECLRRFDFYVCEQTLVWTTVLYHGQKRSAPWFASDQPSVLPTPQTLVPPVPSLNPPFSVLTPQWVWQDPCQLRLSYCSGEKLLEETVAVLAATHVGFYVLACA